MTFEPVQISYRTPTGLLDVQVTPEVIEMLWDGDGGPQTGPEIVETHRPLIEQAVQRILAGVMTAPTELVLTEDDLDPGA